MNIVEHENTDSPSRKQHLKQNEITQEQTNEFLRRPVQKIPNLMRMLRKSYEKNYFKHEKFAYLKRKKKKKPVDGEPPQPNSSEQYEPLDDNDDQSYRINERNQGEDAEEYERVRKARRPAVKRERKPKIKKTETKRIRKPTQPSKNITKKIIEQVEPVKKKNRQKKKSVEKPLKKMPIPKLKNDLTEQQSDQEEKKESIQSQGDSKLNDKMSDENESEDRKLKSQSKNISSELNEESNLSSKIQQEEDSSNRKSISIQSKSSEVSENSSPIHGESQSNSQEHQSKQLNKEESGKCVKIEKFKETKAKVNKINEKQEKSQKSSKLRKVNRVTNETNKPTKKIFQKQITKQEGNILSSKNSEENQQSQISSGKSSIIQSSSSEKEEFVSEQQKIQNKKILDMKVSDDGKFQPYQKQSELSKNRVNGVEKQSANYAHPGKNIRNVITVPRNYDIAAGNKKNIQFSQLQMGKKNQQPSKMYVNHRNQIKQLKFQSRVVVESILIRLTEKKIQAPSELKPVSNNVVMTEVQIPKKQYPESIIAPTTIRQPVTETIIRYVHRPQRKYIRQIYTDEQSQIIDEDYEYVKQVSDSPRQQIRKRRIVYVEQPTKKRNGWERRYRGKKLRVINQSDLDEESELIQYPHDKQSHHRSRYHVSKDSIRSQAKMANSNRYGKKQIRQIKRHKKIKI